MDLYIMYKGLFWLADSDILITYKILCDTEGIPKAQDLPYNSRRGDSFTHKATWEEASRSQPREIRSKTWNHFPRGRVEIRMSVATVYHNPALSSPQFEQRIMEEFELTDAALAVRFIPDHSKHYRIGDAS